MPRPSGSALGSAPLGSAWLGSAWLGSARPAPAPLRFAPTGTLTPILGTLTPIPGARHCNPTSWGHRGTQGSAGGGSTSTPEEQEAPAPPAGRRAACPPCTPPARTRGRRPSSCRWSPATHEVLPGEEKPGEGRPADWEEEYSSSEVFTPSTPRVPSLRVRYLRGAYEGTGGHGDGRVRTSARLTDDGAAERVCARSIRFRCRPWRPARRGPARVRPPPRRHAHARGHRHRARGPTARRQTA